MTQLTFARKLEIKMQSSSLSIVKKQVLVKSFTIGSEALFLSRRQVTFSTHPFSFESRCVYPFEEAFFEWGEAFGDLVVLALLWKWELTSDNFSPNTVAPAPVFPILLLSLWMPALVESWARERERERERERAPTRWKWVSEQKFYKVKGVPSFRDSQFALEKRSKTDTKTETQPQGLEDFHKAPTLIWDVQDGQVKFRAEK